MKNVTVHTNLTIRLTTRDWQLYSSVSGVDSITQLINCNVERILNEAKEPAEAMREAGKVMRRYADYGACDSEPLGVLERLIALRFPEQGW